jgi:hypothetical protein
MLARLALIAGCAALAACGSTKKAMDMPSVVEISAGGARSHGVSYEADRVLTTGAAVPAGVGTGDAIVVRLADGTVLPAWLVKRSEAEEGNLVLLTVGNVGELLRVRQTAICEAEAKPGDPVVLGVAEAVRMQIAAGGRGLDRTVSAANAGIPAFAPQGCIAGMLVTDEQGRTTGNARLITAKGLREFLGTWR